MWDTGDARFQGCAVLLGVCTTGPVGPRSGKDTARGRVRGKVQRNMEMKKRKARIPRNNRQPTIPKSGLGRRYR